MVTRDTSEEHASLTCSESDALNGSGRQQPRKFRKFRGAY
jgi:hypothetical protein